jgi:hypothetical protein
MLCFSTRGGTGELELQCLLVEREGLILKLSSAEAELYVVCQHCGRGYNAVKGGYTAELKSRKPITGG